MSIFADHYFTQEATAIVADDHQAALERCVARLREQMPVIGLRNPKIGTTGNRWIYCDGPDWVMGFYSGELWLAHQLTGDPAFADAARARRPDFRCVLENQRFRDHDLGFQFSLHSVAEWLMTGDGTARRMGLEAATFLMERFRPEGGYIQAWAPRGPDDRAHAAFVAGRMIADTMQNLALLIWAWRETGIADFRAIALAHARTTARHLVRQDDTAFHTYVFDPASGAPLRGETHQGFADDSCWARGQAWLIHGFAQTYVTTGERDMLDTARRLAAKAEELTGNRRVPVWDYRLPASEPQHVDSSAAAIMASGLYILSGAVESDESNRWRSFADRLVAGLLAECDLTGEPGAQGFLGHGAAHVPAGRVDAMLPYGDYYFMEALMRSLGHDRFSW